MSGRVSRVTGFEVLATAVLLCILAAVLFRWGVGGIVHNRPIQVVPDLKGKSVSGALELLAPLSIGLSKEGAEFDSSVPIGSILRQRPAGGTKVREGKILKVVVSQGGETVFTPKLDELPLRNAEMLLRQSQLLLGEVTNAYSLRTEKGLVLSQDPKAETSVERNSPVNVVVSNGEPPEDIDLMPDFKGKGMAEATEWAGGAGVPVTVAKDMESRHPYGTVLEQEPAPDTVVTDATKLKIKVSGRASGKVVDTRMVNFQYQVPQGGSDSLVRIVLEGEQGERELFNGLRTPGSKIDLSVPPGGKSRIKIFLNNILVEERDL
ncbi:MAG: PASTA domain-containing protein [Elusimicrobiota bacterium]